MELVGGRQRLVFMSTLAPKKVDVLQRSMKKEHSEHTRSVHQPAHLPQKMELHSSCGDTYGLHHHALAGSEGCYREPEQT